MLAASAATGAPRTGGGAPATTPVAGAPATSGPPTIILNGDNPATVTVGVTGIAATQAPHPPRKRAPSHCRQTLAAVFWETKSCNEKEARVSFYIGQRVVCVCVNFSREPVWRSVIRVFPQLGCVYTIRCICVVADLIGFCFEEMVNPPGNFSRGFVEPAFDSRKFRPVRTTSIETFRALLVPSRLKSAHEPELV
jgi:hypothetical protein